MEDYPANSRAAKQRTETPRPKAAQEKKIEKVVTGSVVQRKRSLGKRFHDTFVGGDSRSVGQYIVMDVLVPATKDMIHDVITSYVERMLFPDSRPIGGRRRSSSSSSVGRINYGGASSSIRRDPREEDRRRHVSSGSRSKHDFGEIILEKRVEAEEVIDRMIDQIREYGQVSIADLYDMVDVTSQFTDNKWGWYDLEGARVRYVNGGYLLDLPRPVDFD